MGNIIQEGIMEPQETHRSGNQIVDS